MNNTISSTVFLLWEIHYNSVHKTLVDIFSDWLTAENARVGMNSQRTDGFLSYELEERALR